MNGQPSDDSSNAQYSLQSNFPNPEYRSYSLSSLISPTNGIFKNSIERIILKSQSCTAIDKAESSTISCNKDKNVQLISKKDKFAWWMKSSNHKNWIPQKASQSIDIKELEQIDEEEEEEKIEMILDSTSPSVNSNPCINSNDEMNPYNEEMLRWKSAQACFCCTCVNNLIENLPKPPQSFVEATKSQSLNNIYNMYKQREPQHWSKVTEYNPFKIHTREQDSKQIVSFSIDILNFQGNMHSQDDIAPIWKKDCRMWLWKSVCASRKRRMLQNSQKPEQQEVLIPKPIERA